MTQQKTIDGANAPVALAAGFPSVTFDDWLSMVKETLRGKPLESLVQPELRSDAEIIAERKLLYYQEAAHGHAREPGLLNRELREAGDWEIRQRVTLSDPVAANRELLEDLEGGATSLELVPGALERSPSAVVDFLERLFEGVHLEMIGLSVGVGRANPALAAALLALLERRGVEASTARLSFNLDPLAELAISGSLPGGVDRALEQMVEIVRWAETSLPGDGRSKVIRVDTSVYNGAGADAVQELAAGLATLLFYLKRVSEVGLRLSHTQRSVTLRLASGTDLLSEIARLRAARLLWQRMIAACGVEPAPLLIEVTTAERMLTRNDPFVNLLRVTAACFAAIVGGADVVCTSTYHPEAGERGRRLARNTQLILAEETGIDRVLDPAGGSWFFEQRTRDLARSAWSLFQEIERRGGMLEVLRSGWWRRQIDSVHEQRARRIARRKDTLVGVSEFAWLDEPDVSARAGDAPADGISDARPSTESAVSSPLSAPLEGAPVPFGELIASAARGASFVELEAVSGAVAGLPKRPENAQSIEIFPLRRFAEPFEQLRSRAAAQSERPAVFLATLGALSEFNARASFTRNLLAAGGIEGRAARTDSGDDAGFDDEEALVAAFRDSGLRAVVVCSSDAVYETKAESTARVLEQAGAEWIVLAGHPGERRQAYEAAGFDAFVYLGVDALEFLSGLHRRLGVAGNERRSRGDEARGATT